MEQRKILIAIASVAAFAVIILGGFTILSAQHLQQNGGNPAQQFIASTPENLEPMEYVNLGEIEEPVIEQGLPTNTSDTESAGETVETIEETAARLSNEAENVSDSSEESADSNMTETAASQDTADSADSADETSSPRESDIVSTPRESTITAAQPETPKVSSPKTTANTADKTTNTQRPAAANAPRTSTASTTNTRPASTASSTSTASTVPASSGPTTSYWIQVGSYSKKQTAEDANNILKAEGINGIISTREVGSDMYYRLRIGPYENRAEAGKFLEWIRELGQFSQSYISEVVTE